VIFASLLGTVPLLILVWMIGFSGDRTWLRAGGFAALAFKWLVPGFAYGLIGSPAALSQFSTFNTFGTAIVLGGYMIAWAVCSRAGIAARLALGAGGLIMLWPLLFVLAMFVLTYRASI
jgi:hypothetical protein